MEVIRVEQHQIKPTHYLYKYCNDLCFKSKNLYNYANYLIRQEFINNGKWLRYKDIYKIIKDHETYKALMAQTSQQILKLLDQNWKSFFKSIKEWKDNKEKYLGRPKLPKYKKKNGRNIVIFTNQNCKLKDGYIKFPKIMNKEKLKTKIKGKLQQIRIIPKGQIYVIEIIYKKEIEDKTTKNKGRIIGIDLGLNNFATIVNNIGLNPIVVKGKVIKSINQYYNKQLAYYKSILKKQNNKDWSKRLERITMKRNNKIKTFMHKASRFIINYCIENNIDTIVLGNNKNWKQEVKLGKRNNQNFTSIPYETFIQQLQYKAEEVGIKVIVVEESYTSKASFLDKDKMGQDAKFSGKRIKRGLYKSKDGILINADVNGGYNIIRKVFPKAFANGIEGVGLHPVKLQIVA